MTVERKIERKIEELEGQVLFQENVVSGIIYQLNIYNKKMAENEDKKERYWERISEAIDELTIEKRKLEHKMNELKSLKENNLKKGENMTVETYEIYDLGYEEALKYFSADADMLENIEKYSEDEKENLHLN